MKNFFVFFLFVQFTGILAGESIANYISGRVVDERSFPVPNVKVIVRNSEVKTDAEGRFKILNVDFPYDLTIAEQYTSTAVIYKNLSTENPELILFGLKNIVSANSAVVSVYFPDIPKGSSGILKFICNDVFYCTETQVLAGEKNKAVKVFWPASAGKLQGKFVFLQRSELQYTSYRISKVTLSKAQNPVTVNFNKSPEQKINSSEIKIGLPFKNAASKGYSIYADFLTLNRNSQLLLSKKDITDYNSQNVVPSNLFETYRLRISGHAEYNDGSGFVNYTYTKPTSLINLESETPPELQVPSDKLLGASGRTEFYYSLGSGMGIFVIEFKSTNSPISFFIVTAERSAYLSYLSRDEFKRSGGVEFKWKVKKYLTYFSVDDFVRTKQFANDVGYKAVLYSSERTFKTGYF